jgi:hypothetical protein
LLAHLDEPKFSLLQAVPRWGTDYLAVYSQQKVVLKVSSMSDERVKQKAMESVADILGMGKFSVLY